MARRKLVPTNPGLVEELRRIEAEQRAAGEVERAAFRDAWAAKMAAEPARRPLYPSKLAASQ
jgi:hypothetical protein